MAQASQATISCFVRLVGPARLFEVHHKPNGSGLIAFVRFCMLIICNFSISKTHDCGRCLTQSLPGMTCVRRCFVRRYDLCRMFLAKVFPCFYSRRSSCSQFVHSPGLFADVFVFTRVVFSAYFALELFRRTDQDDHPKIKKQCLEK